MYPDYAERMRAIKLGVYYWLCLWDDCPDQEPALV
jgi:hypothetical protein